MNDDDAREMQAVSKPGPVPRHTQRMTIYVEESRKTAMNALRMAEFKANPGGPIPQESEIGRRVIDAGLKALGFDPETGLPIDA